MSDQNRPFSATHSANRSRTLLAALVITTPLILFACERTPSQPPAPTASATTQPSADELANLKQYLDSSAPPQQQRTELPPGHPPLDQAAQSPAAQRATTPPAASQKLDYTVPDTWVAEPARSAMRQAQYRLPPPDDSAAAGELAVFYFGPGGAGGVEANIDRWRTQFTNPDGTPITPEQIKRQTFTVNGLNVIVVEIHGRIAAGPMSAHTDQSDTTADQQLLAAIVETPAGPWFFKALGPPPTISHNRPALLELLHSARYEPPTP